MQDDRGMPADTPRGGRGRRGRPPGSGNRGRGRRLPNTAHAVAAEEEAGRQSSQERAEEAGAVSPDNGEEGSEEAYGEK